MYSNNNAVSYIQRKSLLISTKQDSFYSVKTFIIIRKERCDGL